MAEVRFPDRPASAGAPAVAFPARHRLERALTAAFLGRADVAGRLLAERGVPGRPALFLPGRTLVVVAYQEFSDSPVGPYRQVAVSLPVHVAGRAPVLLPLLCQSLWNTERVFRDLFFYVVEIPVSRPEAVPYSGLWGEPAWTADIEAGPAGAADRSRAAGSARGWEVAVRGEGRDFIVLRAGGWGLGLTERRGYRLVSRLGGEVLADVMRVEAPARLALGPGTASLELGDCPRAVGLADVLGRRPVAVQTLVHGSGTVSFGGPRPLAVPCRAPGMPAATGRRSQGPRESGEGGGVTPLG
ncbi:MAG: hypothetical protein K6U08_04315 [Firmicutes bacterium]|nr:hypothetical protein [Bacillota bacterium]